MKKLTHQEWVELAIADGWRPPLHAHITKEQVEEFIGEEASLIPHYGKKYWITRSGRIVSAAFGRLKEMKIQGGAKIPYKFYSAGVANIYVHRAVAEAYIDNPQNLPYVNHLDGNKYNNDLSNLEWCTAKENVEHAYRLGLRTRRQHV